MDHTTATASKLTAVLQQCQPLLEHLDAREVERRPAPGKWSKKEILGHLIDSAANNHQKFVRVLASDGHVDFVGYAQDAWVATQAYQAADWQALVRLWRASNDHLAHVIAHSDPTRASFTITIDGVGPFRLDFIMADYVEHLTHHLAVVLPQAGLKSDFKNLYGA